MKARLTLNMFRINLLVLLIMTSCSGISEQDNGSTIAQVDTLLSRPRESFDLKVRKYEDPSRQIWQDPKFVIDALGDLSNLVIADIGSGTGYFTFQMAVPAKKVIAIDIEQRFLNYIEDRKSEMYDRQMVNKIETRLTTPTRPSLKSNEVDVVLMVNTIAYIKNRKQYLDILRKGINSGGRLVIVDYKMGKMPVGPADVTKVSENEVKGILEESGYIIDKVDSHSLQYQYLIKAHIN
jgi:ubiquinone/menaquinone biosynthesis C-methylase UbiE